MRVSGAVVCCAVLLAVLAGCGEHHVEPPEASDETAAACEKLQQALPDRVSDQERRPLDDSSGTSAAWGDPAIELRCGVGKPKGFDRFSGCQHANGVDWYAPESAFESQATDVTLTTIGRTPAVAVHIPAEYRPPIAVMADLADAIKAHTTKQKSCV